MDRRLRSELQRNGLRFEGVEHVVIALDDLIANKRAAGRPQDLADVAKLERVREKQRAT